MKERRLAIGGLLLPEIPGWAFTERDDAIVGRPSKGPGQFRILHVPQETMPQPVTHEYCMSVLRMVLITAAIQPTDRQMKESVCGPYGAATFVRTMRRGRWRGEDELIHAWYCRRLPGMIYGLYTCRKALAHGTVYVQTRSACARIMSGVLFDRVGWADAVDLLAQVQLNMFDRVANEDAPH